MSNARLKTAKIGPALLAPSILSADFSRLGDEVKLVEKGGADWIHVDVMDGHFVPNLTIGPVVVKHLRPVTNLPLDCHLMVEKPEAWVGPFLKAGADVITVHVEAAKNLSQTLTQIRAGGAWAGVSLNPATPLADIEPFLDEVDLVLVMSVNPGFGGQGFIDSCLDKVGELKRRRGSRKFLIEIDGGIKADNVAAVRAQGCDAFVAGSAIFSQPDPLAAMREIRRQMK
ncbi:MAG: ribulose-phosphate 3-epimerase [Bacteriovoracia bacterium]